MISLLQGYLNFNFKIQFNFGGGELTSDARTLVYMNLNISLDFYRV